MRRPIRQFLVALAATLSGSAGLPAAAQDSSPPPAWSAREEQSPWISDPRMHQFYEATVDAFADGADNVDRAAYEARSREIFTEFAIANGMSVEVMLDHLKAIPGEMIENARRDPQVLASYDAFVDALFGPQSFPADAPTVGEAN